MNQQLWPRPDPTVYTYDLGMDYWGHPVNAYGRCAFMNAGTGDPPSSVAQLSFLTGSPNTIITLLATNLGVSSILGTTNAILIPLIMVALGL